MKAVLTGFGIGAVITAMFLAAIGGWAVRRKALEARRGWNLVPVMVVAADLAEGEPITAEKLSQRMVPEQFVSESNVRPDEVKPLLGRKLSAPVLRGDPLVWGDFADPAADQALDKCLAAIHPKVVEAMQTEGRSCEATAEEAVAGWKAQGQK